MSFSVRGHFVKKVNMSSTERNFFLNYNHINFSPENLYINSEETKSKSP